MAGKKYLYIIAHSFDDGPKAPCKIGISTDPDKRCAALQTASPVALAVYEMWDCRDSPGMAKDVEAAFHGMNEDQQIRGEWFAMEPEIARQKIELYLRFMAVLSGLDSHEVCSVPCFGENFGVGANGPHSHH